ncbi:MAG TPA: hypothetical protein VHQ64_05755 [Pyrinomonadaceae bacterium]|jgi:hypothetical protein|nr:hypothetical protein [Pyrinomonadaceae bacterium]
MKVTRRDDHDSLLNRRPKIIAAWLALGSASVGADELVAVQHAVNDEATSPAEIARELAREGAELRHPEIIICDARWRAARIESQARTFAGIAALQGAVPLELKAAEAALAELDRLRCTFARDETALNELKSLAVDARKTLIKRAKDASLSPQAREAQAEIAEWLRVWLETPNLFVQWLELRKASDTFTTKFSDP